MGLVTQDSIFNDTIKANISLGQQNATDDEIIEALKYTSRRKDLPKGIHTTQTAEMLSGGQKQRLSIARRF
jgi:subfamily B ATP-binding cassette protein MsbA